MTVWRLTNRVMDAWIRRWGRVVALALVGAASLVLLEVDSRLGLRTLEGAAVALDNLTRARLAVADAALAWEAAQVGDATWDAADQVARLDEATGALEDLLAGRSAVLAFRGASAVTTTGLREVIGQYLARVAAVRAEAVSEAGDRDPVAQRLRLRSLTQSADALERWVYVEVRDQLDAKRRRHRVLMGAWSGFLLIVLLGYAAFRTERVQAQLRWRMVEKERAAAERRYVSLERLAAVGVLRVGADGDVRQASRWWTALLGLDDREALGVPWWEALGEAEREEAAEYWRARSGLGAAFSQDVRVVGGAGRPRWLSGRWEPTGGGNGDVGWVGVILDVTEQRSVEAQLRQAQKLEAVGRLTGGLAHDFNNLLSVILTNTHLLLMDAASWSEDDREMLGDVDRAAKSGRDLVKRLMGFSRRGELSLASVDLGRAVRDAAALAEKLLPETIELSLTVPEEGPQVCADPRAVEQILLNLTANARDAMEGGGTLRVSVEGVEADAEFRGERPWVAPGRYGCLSVSDEGAGMDEATLEQVFEPFFTTKPEGKGTGLGLSTVHGLMQDHNGHVRVYSQVGRGTTFRLYFPAKGPAGEVHAMGAVAARPGGSRAGRVLTILLVEDDQALRRTSARMLVRLGYRVLEAEGGEEALRALAGAEARVDVILSDLAMPGMGGLELYRILRERGDVRPFIFTSGLTQRDVAERGMLPEGAPFLAKPWAATQFLDVMMSLDLRAG